MSIAEKLQTIADNEKKVYDSGYDAGYNAGGGAEVEAAYQQGIADGKQEEYDRFWDVFQANGERTDYSYCFYRNNFDNTTFKPKYDLIPSMAGSMFRQSVITDLKQLLLNAGVVLDTSRCTAFTQAFQSSKITHIPDIDARMATNTSYMVSSECKVVTIDKLLVSETTPLSTTFVGANNLKNVVFEGTIGQNVDLHWSPLTKESIESAMTALSDTASGMTASFGTAAVNTAFETSQGASDGSTSEEWLALVAAKPNWTITSA